MAAVCRAHDGAGGERLEQRRVVPARQRREIGGGVDQLVTEPRRRLAGRVAPQPRDPGLLVGRGEALGRIDMRRDELGERRRLGFEQPGEAAEAGFEAGRQSAGGGTDPCRPAPP